MDLELNTGGRLDGTIHLDQTGLRNQDVIDATIPGYSFVIAERNAKVIWGGYVWSRTYQSQSKDLQLFCQSFEYYPDHQIIENDITIGPDHPVNCFLSLWTNMQHSDEGRNLSISNPIVPYALGDDPIFSFIGNVQVLSSDKKLYGEAMHELSDSSFGFDWYIQCDRVGSDYLRRLVVGYPRLGETATDNSLVFEYPGDILNYYQVESGGDAATTAFAIGAGDGSKLVLGKAVSDLVALRGWPRWDYIASYKDVQDPSRIQLLAEQELATRKAPKIVIKATMKGELVPEFGAWGLGDSVRVVIKDARNPRGFDFAARIAKWTLSPPTGDQVESYDLVFVGDDNG
jgi:hypothetical protein